jgi:hypothetical protein
MRKLAGIAVLSCAPISAPCSAQHRGALDRILQPLIGLVHAHRPLHRHALRGSAFGREAIGMHLGLQLLPARIDLRALLLEARRQAEEREVVVVQLHSALLMNTLRPLSG